MGRLRALFYWMAALDPALTWDERLGRWSDVATVVGVVVTAGVWAVGWLFGIPWWVGLLAGLVAWVVVLNAFVALGRQATPAAEPMPASDSRQTQTRPPVDS